MRIVTPYGQPVLSLLSPRAHAPHSAQVAAVLDYATQNNVEPFLEPVLELSHTIVQRDLKVWATPVGEFLAV